MTRLTPQIAKEIRALSPVWAVCLVAIVMTAWRPYALTDIGWLAYVVGCVGLGALSLGTEYNHRTMSMLLAQPISRSRILALKLAVLLPMLLTLAAPSVWQSHGSWGPHPMLLVLPLVCSLTLTPWLTMACRSPLAGLVFTFAVPAAFVFVGEFAALYRFGLAASDMPRFPLSVMVWGTLCSCALAGAATWRMFMRLEVVDGQGTAVQLPGWLRLGRAEVAHDDRPRSRGPLRHLLQKELRLQQMSLAVAALYVLAWLAVVVLRHTIRDSVGPTVAALSGLHGALQTLLIGSLASAEERQFGTIEWQTLLPVASWKQWGVKVGTVWALAVSLSVGLPALLGRIAPVRDNVRVEPWLVVVVIVCASVSLYVSSLNSTGIRAILVSIPTLVVSWLFLEFLTAHVIVDPPAGSRITPFATRFLAYGLLGALAGGLLFLLLRFAMANHGTAERGAARVWRQALVLACSLAIAVNLFAIGVTLFRALLFPHP